MKLGNSVMEILDKYNWNVFDITKQGNQYCVEIEKYSPEDEDFFATIWFDGTDEDFIRSVRKYAEDFDPDEHAEMWVDSRGKNGVPESIRDLIDDADAIKQMLIEIGEKLNILIKIPTEFIYPENPQDYIIKEFEYNGQKICELKKESEKWFEQYETEKSKLNGFVVPNSFLPGCYLYITKHKDDMYEGLELDTPYETYVKTFQTREDCLKWLTDEEV